jgi:hypothetical protein
LQVGSVENHGDELERKSDPYFMVHPLIAVIVMTPHACSQSRPVWLVLLQGGRGLHHVSCPESIAINLYVKVTPLKHVVTS